MKWNVEGLRRDREAVAPLASKCKLARRWLAAILAALEEATR